MGHLDSSLGASVAFSHICTRASFFPTNDRSLTLSSPRALLVRILVGGKKGTNRVRGATDDASQEARGSTSTCILHAELWEVSRAVIWSGPENTAAREVVVQADAGVLPKR